METHYIQLLRVYGYWRARAEGAGLAGGSHRLCKPAHLCLGGVCEHAGDVVPPRVPYKHTVRTQHCAATKYCTQRSWYITGAATHVRCSRSCPSASVVTRTPLQLKLAVQFAVQKGISRAHTIISLETKVDAIVPIVTRDPVDNHY